MSVLSMVERHEYQQRILIPRFKPLLDKPIMSVLYDIDSTSLIATNMSARSIGLSGWEESAGLSYQDVASSERLLNVFKASFQAPTNEAVYKYCSKIFKIQQQVYKQQIVINYIDVQLTKRIQFGIFESVIWKRMNGNQELLPVDYTFFNPLIGANTIRFGLNTDNNVLAGINAKYQPLKKLYFYGQLAIDDPANGKVGWQLGGKWFDPLGFDDASLQMEVNSAGGRMYAHEDIRQNYSQYNQPLAHPSGGGFFEFLTIANYRTDDYFFEYKFNYINYKEFSSGKEYNSDIQISELTEPDPSETFNYAQLFYQEATVGYLINPKYNMNIMAGWLHRSLHNVITPHKTSYIYIGFRTSLSNFYYDI